MTKLTKKQRKQAAELLALAHERELSEALAVLEKGFQRWRVGEISAADLDNLIHEHHQGPSRKIWKIYSSASDWEIALPGAIHRGYLKVEDFPGEFWAALGPRIEEIRDDLQFNSGMVYPLVDVFADAVQDAVERGDIQLIKRLFDFLNFAVSQPRSGEVSNAIQLSTFDLNAIEKLPSSDTIDEVVPTRVKELIARGSA